MSLARSGTRRVVRTNTLTPGSAGPHPPRKTLDDIQQGIKVLYKPADGAKPDCDIVVIPGLGTDPEKSWQSNKTEFNWIKDSKDGLARDFPKARILLFQYESAWSGGLKVKQFIYNIAISLLLGLRGSREARSTTPVVFLGHSMGGLVIAKAIVLADQRRDLVPTMFECISGCIFFGTPFDGCPAASAASMLAVIGEKVDKTTSSKLLDMMKPGDEGLRELKNDFMRLVAKLTQRIELFCFYEEHPTNFAEQAGLPAIFGIAIPKSLAEFVSRDSATLTGIDALGLASNHRNLVKFQGPKDDRYQLVRGSIKPIIQMSHSIAKSRLNATRNIDRDTVLAVKKVLKGPDMDSIRNAVKRKDTSSSWLVAEPEYQAWLHESPKGQRIDAMWIRGQAGRGKTSNTLAVLDDLDARIADSSGDKAPPLVVFYFCQSGADQSTAEDILKSFLQQLIDQQEILVPHAKHFMKKKAKEDSRETQRSALQLTVENMWQTMQDMLYDPFIGTVYFVVNNLHVLPEDSPSTQKLLGLIGAEVSRTSTSDSDRVPVRWLLSSRNVRTIKTALEAKVVRLIDLEDDKYEDQVKKELRRHAYTKVSDLREEKKYERDVAYFAHSLISKKAQNTQWIDIACLQLKALSDKDSRREVRRILETMPQDLNTLLESAWLRVLHKNANVAEKIKEILRALVLTFEDPTGAELSILAGMSSTDEERSELRQLVESCKPLLTTTRDRENDVKVGFMNIVVKTHLLESSKQLLGMSEDETKWQHGMLAFRSFEHITERFDAVVVVEHQLDEGADDTHGEGSDVAHESATDNGEGDETRTEPEGTVADHHSAWADDSTTSSDDETEEFEEADEEEEDPEALAIKDAALAYPVKYWLRHAGSATKEIAEDLITSDDNDFWAKDSQLRRRYLKEHVRLTGRLEGWPLNSLTGLHVAAAFGFPDLVTALIKHGHDTEINEVDDWENAPVRLVSFFFMLLIYANLVQLHLAACCDRLDIIDVLLDSGAEINHGQEQEVDTPLHMAALEGYVKIMQKLVACGADVNAFAEDTGPVINAAISSGSQEAVELLVSKGANLSLDGHEEIPPPLAAAAKSSNTTLFDFLISACADKLPPREYNLALISAASSGQTEVFDKLMVYRHPQDTFQKAMDAAADETEWSMVKLILERRDGLDCRHVFVEAATAWDDQSEILQAVWQYTKKTLSIDIINEALYHATDYENEDIVRLLLNDFGADANAEAPPSMTTEQGSEGGEGDGETDDDDDEDDEDNEDEDEDEDEEEK
ncbi:hypothetical protein PMZ80_007433 [Knufia obscura]|uniref:Nephrocystin 3-like N-terminal domain-containing protein n=1 Tax=Knufia obscura TaxID=1635080 RepID=A0ABR0RHA4_9EURO|nr:hypothetical protein PMZ80_007433 [Knufia obscura]